MNILGLTYSQLLEEFRYRYDRGEFHAAALYRAFFNSNGFDLNQIPEFSNSPQLLTAVGKDMISARPSLVDKKIQEGVAKFVFQLMDGNRIETVVIPMANHYTVCLSCQVGCRMGCRFCQTGQMGWIRNLSPEEIVSQVYAVKVDMGMDIRNVVFMGMGEPLDNFNNMVQAICVLEDQRGLNIAKSRMTLSTVGILEGIEKLSALNWPQLKLAISLNAPNDDLRTELMPVNRKNSLSDLKNTLARYPLPKGGALFMEYVLIKGMNDGLDHARQLADYVKGLPVKLNLIPYNPRRNSPFSAPKDDDIDQFHKALIDHKVFVRLRRSKGTDIQAACGQLGSKVVGV